MCWFALSGTLLKLMATIEQKVKSPGSACQLEEASIDLRKTNNVDLRFNKIRNYNLFLACGITLALGEGGEIVFRLPIADAQKY